MPRKRTTKPKRTTKRKRTTTRKAVKSLLASVPRTANNRPAGKWQVLKTCDGPVCTTTGTAKQKLSKRDKERIGDYNRVLSELEALAEASASSDPAWQDFADFIAFNRQQLKDGVKEQYELTDDDKTAYKQELAKAGRKADDTKIYVSNVDWGALDAGNFDPADAAQINRLLGKGFVTATKARNGKRSYKVTRKQRTKGKAVALDHPALVRVGWSDDIQAMIDAGDPVEVRREYA